MLGPTRLQPPGSTEHSLDPAAQIGCGCGLCQPNGVQNLKDMGNRHVTHPQLTDDRAGVTLRR